jgi:hypothetical protein
MIRRQALQHGRDENTSRAQYSEPQARCPENLATSRTALAIGSTLALSLALFACGAGEEADGMPDFGNAPAFPGGSQNSPGSSVNNGSVNNNPSNSNSNSNSGSQNGSTGSQTGTGNNSGGTTPATNPSNPSTPSAPTTNVTEGNPGNTPISSGTSMTGAMAGGAGGANNGGMPPTTDTNPDPNTPPPVTTPPPAAPDIVCPSGAIFCSGFEGTGFPAGTTFEPSYLAAGALGTEVTLDATVAHSGRQSLKMPVGHNYYRMLSVATPASYWVRLYARSTVGLGAKGSTHATFFMGSTVAPGGDYNADRPVQIAEQFDQVLLNVQDVTFGTGGVSPNGKPGTQLPNNTWSCMEAQFDGATGDVRVFVEGNEIIDASGWQPPTAFKSFRFGYMRFVSPDRDVWMDDVIVATSRIGCT